MGSRAAFSPGHKARLCWWGSLSQEHMSSLDDGHQHQAQLSDCQPSTQQEEKSKVEPGSPLMDPVQD